MKYEQSISPARKELSKAFLRELLMDNSLRTVSGFKESENLRLPGCVSLPAAFPVSQEPVERGQIRLLSQLSFPTYVAVLDKWNGDGFLVAPFSRFGQPATDEEFKTAYDGGAFMRVLQIWNARSAMEMTLRRSWLVGTLPKQDIDDALLLWKWSVGDIAELPARIAERTGVPIYRTDDPRLDYRREALESFAAFDAEDDNNAERTESEDSDGFTPENFLKSLRKCAPLSAGKKVGGPIPFTPETVWASMERFGILHRVEEEAPVGAAAASMSGNSRRTFLVAGVLAKLRAEYSRSEKCLVFSVWDGSRRVKSDALDGFMIVVAPGTEPVPIRNKSARIPAASPSAAFVLLDPAGKVVDLKKVKG